MARNFVKIGTRVKYTGELRCRYDTWPPDKWLEFGVTGAVTEYHVGWKANPQIGETEDMPDCATVTWDFGGQTLIYQDGHNKLWQRIS